jgi:hypothetical protein
VTLINMPLRYPHNALQVNIRKIKRAITNTITKTTQTAAKSAFKGKLMDQTVELRHARPLPLNHLPKQMQPFVHHRPIQIAVLKRMRRRRGEALVVVEVGAADLLHPSTRASIQ